MRTIRKLSFFMILGVAICTLTFFGINSLQANNTGKKPVKPPEANWAVEFPEESGMLYGDGTGIYSGQEENIEVKVELNTLVGPWKKDNDFVTHIAFKILNPPSRSVDFEGVVLEKLSEGNYDWIEPDYGKPCSVFPYPYDGCEGLCDNCAVDCMQGFMNNDNHPHSDYAGFYINIHAFDKDITTMGYNVPYQLGTAGHYHDYIQMTLGYQTGDITPDYHSIECSKSAHLGPESLHDFNIWITRTGEDTWRIDVGIDEEGNIVEQFFFLEEYYYEKSEGKGKKGKGGKTEFYSTLFAGGDFHFTFNLIRETT